MILRRLTLGLALFTVALAAQTFPRVEAENLLGKKVELPAAAAGHAAVVVIGFTHASQNQTKAWAERLRKETVEVYSIAVLQEAPKLVRGMAVHGIKSSVPENQRATFLLVYKGEQDLKQAAGFEQADDAYVLLLSAGGEVRQRLHGPVTEEAVKQLLAP